ncbi:MAG: heme-binding domain-containing protein [Balneolaceae bacterium]|nr:heme-binding domain-containing protein [Balneolaceae bacterium]
MIQKIAFGLLAVLVILQFFQIDKTNPVSNPANDFMNIANPPEEVATILKTACYDCHSNNTRYPWYTNIQPVAWWIKDHIDHGRSELNFSEFGTYSQRRADHKLEESAEYILSEEMPLPSFTWAHAEARLTDEERTFLADWFEEQRTVLFPDTSSTPEPSSGR